MKITGKKMINLTLPNKAIVSELYEMHKRQCNLVNY